MSVQYGLCTTTEISTTWTACEQTAHYSECFIKNRDALIQEGAGSFTAVRTQGHAFCQTTELQISLGSLDCLLPSACDALFPDLTTDEIVAPTVNPMAQCLLDNNVEANPDICQRFQDYNNCFTTHGDSLDEGFRFTYKLSRDALCCNAKAVSCDVECASDCSIPGGTFELDAFAQCEVDANLNSNTNMCEVYSGNVKCLADNRDALSATAVAGYESEIQFLCCLTQDGCDHECDHECPISGTDPVEACVARKVMGSSGSPFDFEPTCESFEWLKSCLNEVSRELTSLELLIHRDAIRAECSVIRAMGCETDCIGHNFTAEDTNIAREKYSECTNNADLKSDLCAGLQERMSCFKGALPHFPLIDAQGYANENMRLCQQVNDNKDADCTFPCTDFELEAIAHNRDAETNTPTEGGDDEVNVSGAIFTAPTLMVSAVFAAMYSLFY